MGISQQDRVKKGLDIPASAAVLYPAPTTTAVTNVTAMHMVNRLTYFEELVLAVTQGYLAGGKYIGTDAQFAESVCNLARAISYERDKYSNL